MVTINLLPWRDTVSAYERKVMQRMLLTVLACSVSMVCLMQSYVAKQEARLHLKVDRLNKSATR